MNCRVGSFGWVWLLVRDGSRYGSSHHHHLLGDKPSKLNGGEGLGGVLGEEYYAVVEEEKQVAEEMEAAVRIQTSFQLRLYHLQIHVLPNYVPVIDAFLKRKRKTEKKKNVYHPI